ncbi:hypothetical protein HNP46_006120 [Pseudomonas nitritireducens]|uniref:Uncharacterized protein n=1 Tax=Pseudomonas nitroreducens TaxID=46680 RepID=A0A7W7KQN7_PSENT|nr:hypothetical protein [Pseudomonas nitritireducens]MBB4867209.1 hypothetical protein [Pseudomonas nitritireducens]
MSLTSTKHTSQVMGLILRLIRCFRGPSDPQGKILASDLKGLRDQLNRLQLPDLYIQHGLHNKEMLFSRASKVIRLGTAYGFTANRAQLLAGSGTLHLTGNFDGFHRVLRIYFDGDMHHGPMVDIVPDVPNFTEELDVSGQPELEAIFENRLEQNYVSFDELVGEVALRLHKMERERPVIEEAVRKARAKR